MASPCHATPPKSCMPSARADEFRRVAIKLGFKRLARQQVMSGGSTKTAGLRQFRSMAAVRSDHLYRILEQMGIDERRFNQLR